MRKVSLCLCVGGKIKEVKCLLIIETEREERRGGDINLKKLSSNGRDIYYGNKIYQIYKI